MQPFDVSAHLQGVTLQEDLILGETYTLIVDVAISDKTLYAGKLFSELEFLLVLSGKRVESSEAVKRFRSSAENKNAHAEFQIVFCETGSFEFYCDFFADREWFERKAIYVTIATAPYRSTKIRA